MHECTSPTNGTARRARVLPIAVLQQAEYQRSSPLDESRRQASDPAPLVIETFAGEV